MGKAIIIGGGAAGMYAAIAAADNGCEVHLYEKNEKLGKKLFITGKGRCNLTNACDVETLLRNQCRNEKFLYSAFRACTSQDVMAFFEEEGLTIKTERGNRVFPASDHSSDVIRTLEKAMRRRGVRVHLHTEVKDILTDENGVTGVRLMGGHEEHADYVAVAAGGSSYASTGSDGSGIRLARACGVDVTEVFPALVPLETEEDWPKELMGLSLRNVSLQAVQNGKVLYEELGEMLFTHFGVSGPLVLSASSYVTDRLGKELVTLTVDLKPALSEKTLDARILRDFDAGKNKQFKNVLGHLLPAKMIPVMIRLSGIDPDKPVNLVTKQEREVLVHLFKHLPMTVKSPRGFAEAIITKGGVSVKEIRPGNMECKKIPGLYFIGEVLDLDALTGGFNLQVAWTTGAAAGRSMY